MKRITTITTLAVVIITFIATGAFAGEMMKSKRSEIMEGSKLIGASVENTAGETLGKISDIAFDPGSDRITFAILSHGGLMGMGDKLIVVPMSALSFRSPEVAVLDISKEKLQTAPSFDKKDWPNLAGKEWTENTYRFFGVMPHWETEGMEMEQEEMMEDVKETEKGMQKEMMEKGKKKSGYGY